MHKKHDQIHKSTSQNLRKLPKPGQLDEHDKELKKHKDR
jgi:hypothetical protein